MSKIETGGPAFPMADPFIAHSPGTVDEAKRMAEGMSLRDYFAAKALPMCMTAEEPAEVVAGMAYAMADAMLKAREAQC